MKKITSGVYILYKNNNIVYVGESANILSRIGEHIRENMKDFDEFEYFELNEEDRMDLEAFIIRVMKPKYNMKGGSPSFKRKLEIPLYSNEKYIKSLDKELVNACKNLYKTEKYIFIRVLSDVLGITSMHLMATLHKLEAPIIRDYDLPCIEKKWLYKNFEKFIDLL